MNNQDQPNLLVARLLVEPGITEIMHIMVEQLPEVFRHSLNVAYLTAEICYSQVGKEMRTDLIYDKLDCIRGTLLHDIGKLDISKDILHKRDELTLEEVRILIEHPKLGYRKICELEKTLVSNGPIHFSDTVKDIILHHHKCVDGTGYPDNIKEVNYPPPKGSGLLSNGSPEYIRKTVRYSTDRQITEQTNEKGWNI